MRPKEAANLEFWEEMILVDGFIQMQEEAPDGYYEDDYDPRFPSASRGDVMASPEELMGFGIQYERIES
jgi:hypothetical protein